MCRVRTAPTKGIVSLQGPWIDAHVRISSDEQHLLNSAIFGRIFTSGDYLNLGWTLLAPLLTVQLVEEYTHIYKYIHDTLTRVYRCNLLELTPWRQQLVKNNDYSGALRCYQR